MKYLPFPLSSCERTLPQSQVVHDNVNLELELGRCEMSGYQRLRLVPIESDGNHPFPLRICGENGQRGAGAGLVVGGDRGSGSAVVGCELLAQ